MRKTAPIPPGVEKWLTENYAKYTIDTCAVVLSDMTGTNVTANRINHWTKVLDLKRVKAIEPTEVQKRFIRDKYSELEWTAADIAVEMNMRLYDVHQFIAKEGLRKSENKSVPKKKVKRHRADHQNVNHDDRISKWISLDISQITGRYAY
jgi:hypothetical protein